VRSLGLYLRAIRRPLLAGRPSFGRADERLVFVFGSPRSGTTFLAGAIGSLPGFVDLGEVNPLKAAIPDIDARDVRRVVDRVRRFGLVGSRRAVEQTPETAFVLPTVAQAFPQATLVHAVRDGRDVVCSLLERGWLSADRDDADDAGLSFGTHPRFWVEPGRADEFRSASDTRRCAWVWRRYVTAARESDLRLVEVRYEQLATTDVAARLAHALGVSPDRVGAALDVAHTQSVGRWRDELDAAQLADVEAEAGDLLAELGYTR
jgi:sulfotransferase family protein